MRKNIPFHYVDLALKFLEGNSTRKEDTELDQWIRQDPRHLELFEKINLNWQSRPQHRPGTMQAYTELASRLGLPGEADQSREPVRIPQSRVIRWAASLTAILAVAAGAWYFLSREKGITYHTGYAQVRTFLLPDSSVVTLNANSTLTIDENWMEQADRRVSLNGEAFFEVKKQLQESPSASAYRKFIVSTGNLEVEVLGTSFNVNYRDSETSVALNSGSIRLKLRKNSREILMHPGDLVEVTPAADPVIRNDVEVTNYSSWKTGQLFLDGSNIRELKALLQHNYGLRIQFETPENVRDVRLRGKFPADDPALLLKAIADVTGTVLKQENGRIFYMQKAKLK